MRKKQVGAGSPIHRLQELPLHPLPVFNSQQLMDLWIVTHGLMDRNSGTYGS